MRSLVNTFVHLQRNSFSKGGSFIFKKTIGEFKIEIDLILR